MKSLISGLVVSHLIIYRLLNNRHRMYARSYGGAFLRRRIRSYYRNYVPIFDGNVARSGSACTHTHTSLRVHILSIREENKYKPRAQLLRPHQASCNYRESRCSLRETGKKWNQFVGYRDREAGVIITDHGEESTGNKNKKRIRKKMTDLQEWLMRSTILRLLTYIKITFIKLTLSNNLYAQ